MQKRRVFRSDFPFTCDCNETIFMVRRKTSTQLSIHNAKWGKQCVGAFWKSSIALKAMQIRVKLCTRHKMRFANAVIRIKFTSSPTHTQWWCDIFRHTYLTMMPQNRQKLLSVWIRKLHYTRESNAWSACNDAVLFYERLFLFESLFCLGQSNSMQLSACKFRKQFSANE